MGGGEEKTRIHWRRWSSISLPKHLGGLEFRYLKAINVALFAKQGCRLVKNPNSFWVALLKFIYFPNTSFWKVSRGVCASWASWRWKVD